MISAPIGDTESYFGELAKGIPAFLQGREVFTCAFSAERSDFVRLNHARVRQAGQVQQAYLQLRLIDGGRHAAFTLTLTGDLSTDLTQCRSAFDDLRHLLPDLPDDPLLSINTEVTSTRLIRSSKLPRAEEMTATIAAAGTGHDLVGFLASGPIQRGFANSYGQLNWHEVTSFNFEWSLYYETDKAAKTHYAGFEWDAEVLRGKMIRATNDLEVLRRPPRDLAPGGYRVFLAPSALSEIASMLSWGGFSAKAAHTRQSPLQKMVDKYATLNPMVTFVENIDGGLAPGFQAEGYARPLRLPLIQNGEHANLLVSPRTAREYGLAQNGADTDVEAPQSLDMAAGTLANHDMMRELGTGLCINNLWYLNFSDRMNCKLTGMTRFATFWVENGEPVAPCNVMRFDDTVYRILGSNLAALTAEREFLPDASTYGSRMTQSRRLPGAIVDDFMLAS